MAQGKALKGRQHPMGAVSDAVKVRAFRNALGLNQAASEVSWPWPAAAAAGAPTADGGGGGGGAGTDAQVIELTRKIAAMEAQIEQLEQRNASLGEYIKIPNSNFASAVYHLN